MLMNAKKILQLITLQGISLFSGMSLQMFKEIIFLFRIGRWVIPYTLYDELLVLQLVLHLILGIFTQTSIYKYIKKRNLFSFTKRKRLITIIYMLFSCVSFFAGVVIMFIVNFTISMALMG